MKTTKCTNNKTDTRGKRNNTGTLILLSKIKICKAKL